MIDYNFFPEMTPLRKKFHELYQSWGLDRDEGANCQSYSDCSKSCELVNRNIWPPTISYIGDAYEASRVLFAGINTNRGSDSSKDLYSVYDWISKDGSETDPYIAGAIHRITKKLINKPNSKPNETKQVFSFINMTKCSVVDEPNREAKSGEPTDAMSIKCILERKYALREIELLQPKLIVCLGDPPYNHIRDLLKDTCKQHESKYSKWICSICINGVKIIVIGLYNPVQGYKYLRGYWSGIKTGAEISKSYKVFWPDGITNTQDLVKHLEQRYSGKNLVDSSNPFYELMVDTLIEVAFKELH